MKFYCDCVGWPPGDVYSEGGLCDMVDAATDVTREEFLERVDPDSLGDVERELGYDADFPMSRDWHVSYHRSELHGETVYFFDHSRIEHVFREDETE